MEKIIYSLLTFIMFMSFNSERTAAAVPEVQKQSSSKDISIVFAGDAMMDWSVKNTIRAKGPDYPFRYVKSEVQAADYAVVNLETAITTRSAKYPKEYNFKSDPVSLRGLYNAGFDTVSLANNHSMDFQTPGLLDTMVNLRKYKLSYIGAGVNSSIAYRAKEVKIKGKSIKFLAFSRVLPSFSWVAGTKKAGLANGYDLNLIKNVVKRESRTCDYLMVYMHWGVEKSKRPEKYQMDYAKAMINSGADAIIGSHPHVLQGFQYYKGRPIAYSLGNFLFPNYVKGEKAETGLLKINIKNGGLKMQFKPYYIRNDVIVKLSPASEKRILNKLSSLSYGAVVRGYDVVVK